MQTAQADISYKILQLAVLEGEVDLSQLRIFREKTVYIAELGITVQAGIIGTSHFIQVQTDSGKIFTEILACNAMNQGASKALCAAPLSELGSKNYTDNSCLSYDFQYSLEKYDKQSGSYAILGDQQDHIIYLEYDFDSRYSDLPTAKTIIAVRKQASSLKINTVHEYQEENTVVLSESKLKF